MPLLLLLIEIIVFSGKGDILSIVEDAEKSSELTEN